MKTKLATLLLLLCGITLTYARPTSKSVTMAREEFTASAKFTAKVTDIDYKTREVTVQTEDGQKESFIAGDDIKRLKEVKKGDILKGDYAQTFAYEISKGGKAVPLVEQEPIIKRKYTDKPQAVLERNITTSVLITAIDKKAPSVTVENAKGEKNTVKVSEPEALDAFKVGDTVDFKLKESLSLKVEKPKESQNF